MSTDCPADDVFAYVLNPSLNQPEFGTSSSLSLTLAPTTATNQCQIMESANKPSNKDDESEVSSSNEAPLQDEIAPYLTPP